MYLFPNTILKFDNHSLKQVCTIHKRVWGCQLSWKFKANPLLLPRTYPKIFLALTDLELLYKFSDCYFLNRLSHLHERIHFTLHKISGFVKLSETFKSTNVNSILL